MRLIFTPVTLAGTPVFSEENIHPPILQFENLSPQIPNIQATPENIFPAILGIQAIRIFPSVLQFNLISVTRDKTEFDNSGRVEIASNEVIQFFN